MAGIINKKELYPAQGCIMIFYILKNYATRLLHKYIVLYLCNFNNIFIGHIENNRILLLNYMMLRTFNYTENNYLQIFSFPWVLQYSELSIVLLLYPNHSSAPNIMIL